MYCVNCTATILFSTDLKVGQRLNHATNLFLHLQLNETIVIELFDAANTKQLIASPSSVDVTVLENDDPYGVFKFVTSSLSVAIGKYCIHHECLGMYVCMISTVPSLILQGVLISVHSHAETCMYVRRCSYARTYVCTCV